MSKTSQSEGTKIAQAAKELNVTSVTIRRYLSEFNIEATTDDNGVKVLPQAAMDELQLIRQLKEDGLTNPKVLEELEERRAKQSAPKSRGKERPKATKAAPKVVEVQREQEEEQEEEAPVQPPKRGSKQASKVTVTKEQPEPIEEPEEEESTEPTGDLSAAGGRSKHSLTCQTCGKVFEHINPRLRDCLDCYRTKRKERRRGGSDKHKNVIQHPVVQQVIAKSSQSQLQAHSQAAEPSQPLQQPQPRESYAPPPAQPTVPRQSTVRNYRKAIEDTRGITASLKRRLERPDLPEGERRWLEQIYAYQLILHQGWRHLSEYRAGTKEQHRSE
jgi:DNA-binding transcriptional MerR regulator